MLGVGIIVGIIVMLIAYCFSMYIYFKARQKFSEVKYMVEIIAVVVAILFSVSVKLIINLSTITDGFTNGFASLLHAIYSTIGGLTFEGLSDLSDIENGIIQCLYTASSLYAGMIVLSVITAKASYEIYCGIKLRILKMKLRFSKRFANKTDIYIFTSVTSDSLILAESIKDKYVTDRTDRNAEIIFTGELEVFSRENLLHREIMADGFIYWSYSKKINEEKEPSILKRLGLYIDNCFYKKDCKCKDSRIHIFALSNNEGLSGYEAENGNIVFGEMKAILKEYEKASKKVFVDFYLLVDNEINYEVYKSKLDILKAQYNVIAKNINKKHSKNGEDVTGLEGCFPFVLHLINEADYTAKDFIYKRDKEYAKFLPNKNLFKTNSYYRAMVIGFGQTGQTATMQAFINTSNVTNRVPNKFIADVFDLNMNNVGGLFLLRHPLVDGKVVSGNLEGNCSKVDEHSKIFKEKLNKIYSPIYTQTEIDNLNGDVSAEVIKKMTFPIINMYQTSCFGKEFVNYFNNDTGHTILCKYNLVIVGLGDDEINIAMANALLGEIRNQLADGISREESGDITIAINIRDAKNLERIDWGETENKLFPDVHVIKFGVAEEIYSYDVIVDDSEAMMYSYPYALLECEDISDVYMDLVNEHNEIIKNGNVDNNDYTEKLQEIFTHFNRNHDMLDIRKTWVQSSLFDRESNNSVAIFSNSMKALCKDLVFTYDNMSWLVDIEHERWDRFHIANGWIFNVKKCKPYRQHDCILPTEKLKDKFGKYDLVNAVRSIFEKIYND